MALCLLLVLTNRTWLLTEVGDLIKRMSILKRIGMPSCVLLCLFMALRGGAQVSLTTLGELSGTNGNSLWAGVILGSAGSLYGTTEAGGASTNWGPVGLRGYGAIFRITLQGEV